MTAREHQETLAKAFATLGEEFSSVADENAQWTPIAPVPIPAADDKPTYPTEWGRLCAQWQYLDAAGNLQMVVCRFEKTGGVKSFRPRTYCQNGARREWRWQALPPLRPLYNLDKIVARSADPVLVCEGEKTVDAASQLFPDFVCITSASGAGNAQNADWRQLLGRDVVIWPDNDEAGHRYAVEVTQRLFAAGCESVKVVQIPSDWPKSWDLADEPPEGITRDHLARLVHDAASQQPASARGTHPRSIRVMTLQELLREQFPPRSFIMDPILPEKGLAMLYARRGMGKTWAALALGYAVAAGASFWKWKAPEPRQVLHVCGEMPALTLQTRLKAIIAGSGTPEPPEDYFRILSADAQEHSLPDLASEAGQSMLRASIGDAQLIVLDNVSTLFRSGRENEAESWSPVQELLLELRRNGRSVLLVHHAGKGGTQRGTSRREDVLDTVIALRPPSDYVPKQGARFEVHFEKARGLVGGHLDPFEGRLEMQGDAASWVLGEIKDPNAAVNSLLAEGLSVRDIEKQTGMSKSAVARKRQRIQPGRG